MYVDTWPMSLAPTNGESAWLTEKFNLCEENTPV